MFGLGMPEILLILAIALIVIGPKKLPDLAKSLGRSLGEFKRAAQDFKNSIDLEGTVKEFNEPVKNIKNDFKAFADPLSKTTASVKEQNVNGPAIEPKEVTNIVQADKIPDTFGEIKAKVGTNNANIKKSLEFSDEQNIGVQEKDEK